jgi:hypothetical protein
MAQPTPYDRITSFTNYQTANPSEPLNGPNVDAELNAIKATLDQILDNLELIQRDDGELANESVGLDQLSEEIEVGWEAPEVWVTATAYTIGNTVFSGSGFYRCLVAHTSGVFATDLAASKWELIVNLASIPLVNATQVAFTPTGAIAATNVATALAELDSEKAALSHTHLSSAITDSTAAGRAMLSAADVTAQQVLLGLGDLAFLDAIPVTAVAGELAFTGDISPAALNSNTNNWAPTGWATASRIRMSASTAITITGLSATTDGDRKVLENVGSNTITLAASDGSSTAANRLSLPRSVPVGPNQSIELEYDGTSTRWRALNMLPTNPVSAVYKNLRVFNVATHMGDSAPGTPNSQVKVAADELILSDTNGETYRAQSVAVTIDSASLGANGGDVGGIPANSTWYSLWVIFNPATTTVAGLMSASATAPTMPSGYTFKARVGWNRTNGSGQFNRIVQYGNKAQYVVSASVTTALPNIANGSAGTFSGTAPTWAAAAVGSFVPSTAASINVVATNTYANGAVQNVMVAPNNTYSGSASTNPPPLSFAVSVSWALSAWLTLESTNIYWASSGAGGGIFAAGWEDNI